MPAKMTSDYRYEKKHGSYYLLQALDTGRDDILLMSDSIAIMIDVEEGTLVKHGKPELVRKRHSEYAAAGLFPDNFVVIESARWEVEDLNRFINNSHAVGAWYKHQLALAAAALAGTAA